MKISKNITITLTDEEQRILEQAKQILDKLGEYITDNDLNDDYDIDDAYNLLEDIADQDGQFSFGREDW